GSPPRSPPPHQRGLGQVAVIIEKTNTKPRHICRGFFFPKVNIYFPKNKVMGYLNGVSLQ
ncbi:MAG: hypothetical protein ACSW8I_09275, partial [bacterium]